MPKILEICELGNPILRERIRDTYLSEILDPKTQSFIDDMYHTCIEAGGLGLAAPQVGKLMRICIIASRPIPRYPTAPKMEPVVMINPIISTRKGNDPDWLDYEGCLSIPGLRGLVKRHSHITVSYLDRDGNPQNLDLEGFPARICQHEEDHLNGVVFTDISHPSSFVTSKEYDKILASM